MRRRPRPHLPRRSPASRPRRMLVLLLAAGLMATGAPALTATASAEAPTTGSAARSAAAGQAERAEAPPAPRALTLDESRTGKVRLRWKAPEGGARVAAYDVYANGRLRTGLPTSAKAPAHQYTDTPAPGTKVKYTVRARSEAGKRSPASNAVTRAGRGGDTQAPTAPGHLTLKEREGDRLTLAWQRSTDDRRVTGYAVYAGDRRVTNLPADSGTYTVPRAAASRAAAAPYEVRARDRAGNISAPSNAVRRTPGPKADADLAAGKPISASSHTHTYVAGNANDGDTSTYWEGGGSYPQTLTVKLGANAETSAVAVKLNPDSVWGPRTQTIQVLGREQDADAFTSLVAGKEYAFDPASGNTVTIPVSARVADVQLRFTANSGAPGGQAAEFQVLGTPAPNPDLEVTGVTADPAQPVESDTIELSATVRNSGTAASPATSADFTLGGSKAGSASVRGLAAGASATVTTEIGKREAGSYQLGAEVDPADEVIEQNDTNNTYTSPDPLIVKPVDSSDLVASQVSWSPGAPSAGDTVTFQAAVKNQGTRASAGGGHGITLDVLDEQGRTVETLTGAHTGAVAPGATTEPVRLGTWKAANGSYTVRVTLDPDANEVPVKRENNTSTKPLFIGRGADMPYDTYEAEDAALGGGARTVGPNREIGDLAGEASGRKAVTLHETGSSVEFTAKAATNTLVTRFSLPDAPGGGGIDATLNVYVDGTFLKALDLTSKYAWLYGPEASPGNSPGAGPPRHIYDEAHLMLGETVPAGSRIKLQKDAANTSQYAIDFVDLEQVSATPNPDPATYATPDGFTHQDVQNALDRVRMDTTGTLVGVYLPPGDYRTSSKFQVYGKAVKVIGAGPWYTRFLAPEGQENTDIGFRADATAKGSSFADFAYFGNYTSRIDGPGKVFDFANVSDIVIDNVWNEHMVCLYWGANTDGITLKNSRIRNMFADGVNMTNGSTDNHVVNNEARATGDDSFALFSAIDAGGADMKDNVYENLTSLLTWRAAGIAVYGGHDNVFRNLRVADTLVYSGVTISSLDFGYPMNGFGPGPTTFENVSLERAGGHFWNGQTFPAMWLFSASKAFREIRVNNLDIVDPTYSGIMFQTNYVGGQPQNPVTDTVFRDVTISGARKSGDAHDAKSGFGIWANELPEPGQGPAVGEATFHNLRFTGNAQDVKNTTSTFTLNLNP